MVDGTRGIYALANRRIAGMTLVVEGAPASHTLVVIGEEPINEDGMPAPSEERRLFMALVSSLCSLISAHMAMRIWFWTTDAL